MDQEDPKLVLEAPLLSNIEKGPLVVVSFLQYSLTMISVMFIGHLGELPLSSSSMATSFAGATGFSLMLGMGSALETFCGQAYGAKQYHMLGVDMQRAMLVLTLMCIPIALPSSCTDLKQARKLQWEQDYILIG
ncbi:Multi antimicrobial extrusion protein [Trema orientale]|uniref:Multi antimicrobial extrusion protein n=1 Tax=Trema orientale TaxID=63057 RepID=A0A2P5FG48_TREOI|nr:Multi antimicrobial extrusion protein [Trema orientale]